MTRPDPLIQGTVRSVMADKGFGFIHGHDGKEYFFHRSDVADYEVLEVGTAVRFRPTEGAKGPRAAEVELV